MKSTITFWMLFLTLPFQQLYAQTWTQLTSGFDSALHNVCFLNQDIGFVSGAYGKILKTENGGTTWVAKNSGTTEGLACIQFVSSTVGYASSGFYPGFSTVIKTIDGGNTWTKTNVKPLMSGSGMWFLNANKGFYACADGLYHSSVILRTLNGGDTWDTVYQANGWVSFFHFADSLHGFATVNNGTVLKTTDGGSSWTTQNLGNTLWGSGIYFLNKDTGFVGGQPKSGTGGAPIYKTVNAGLTWTPIASANMIFKICFSDADHGYALTVDTTGAGFMIKTANSGSSWAIESTPKNNLRGIYFLNSSLGFAVGDSGVILKYANSTGINPSVHVSNGINIYPNPVNDMVFVDIESSERGVHTMNIYAASGAMVRTVTLRTGHQQIDLSGLGDGMYWSEIISDGSMKWQKLIIQK